MIRAILFDLGDTLLDFQPMDTRAVFRQAARLTYDHLAALGYSLPRFERYAGRYFRALRWAYFLAKFTRREFDSFELLRKFHRKMHLPHDNAILSEMAWLWYQPLAGLMRAEENLVATLTALREHGIAMGVVSNTFVPAFVHDRHLEAAGLLPFLSVRVYSSEVRHRKPDPRIFQAALARLNVSPAHAMFVGDLVKTDIVGARRAGMRTALKQPFSNKRPHRLADHVIARLSELLEIVRAHRA